MYEIRRAGSTSYGRYSYESEAEGTTGDSKTLWFNSGAPAAALSLVKGLTISLIQRSRPGISRNGE